jgi:hypothetical protein
MAQMARDESVTPAVASIAIGIGVLSNTCVKLAVAAIIGRGRFRMLSVTGLAAMAALLAAGLVWTGR